MSAAFTITRIFNAPRELAWKAWTTPEYVQRWWGPQHFTAPECRIDLHVGGKLHYNMRAPDGTDYWNIGEFLEIIAPEKLVYSMMFSNAAGEKLLPASIGFGPDFPAETIHSIIFEAIDADKTRVNITTNVPGETASRYMMDKGWEQSLDKVTAALI